MKKNIDKNVVAGFGDEWSRFDQSELEQLEQAALFDSYFSVFPWEKINLSSEGFDMGCGSGRWAQLVALRVGSLHCIDAAKDALDVARTKLNSMNNCHFHLASVEELPLADASQDFGYSLGVLHHIPNTQSALNSCVQKLKIGAPFLIYCYYKFDNRPWWFKYIWRISEFLRSVISKLPMGSRYFISQIVAFVVYWPLSRTAKLIEYLGFDATNLPLYFYRDKSIYVLRTDALDRFGTRLEQRFTKNELELMMSKSGLSEIRFSKSAPYWCAVGIRRKCLYES